MIGTSVIENGHGLTEEQLREKEEAQKHPITFDEDCQELSPAMMKAFFRLLHRRICRYIKKEI